MVPDDAGNPAYLTVGGELGCISDELIFLSMTHIWNHTAGMILAL